MEEQIAVLFETTLSPQATDEVRAKATQMLLQLYENPASAVAIFSLISNKNYKYRQMAAVCLRKCLKSFWENVDANTKEVIKNFIINVLSTETELLIARNIIESCEIVFETETQNWPTLFTFIANNSQVSLLNLEITLYLIYMLALYLDTNLIEANFNLFQAIANQGINSQDQEAILLTCEMLGALISFISTEKISLCQPQEAFLMQVFLNYLTMPNNQNSEKNIERVGFALADTFLGNALPIPAVTILQQLLQALQSPGLPKERYFHIFTVIQYLIKKHADELIGEAETLLKATILYGAAAFDANDYETIYDLNLITCTAGDFAGELKMPRFIKLIQSLAPKEANEALLISYAHVLYNAIDECEDEVANDIKPIVETTIQFLKTKNLYLNEIGVQIAVIIGDSLEPSQLDIAVLLLQHLMPFIVSGIQSITFQAFSAITIILNQGLIRNDMVPQVLSTFISVLQNDRMIDIHYLCIEAISSLVFAVEEDILPYSNQILPIIIKAATLPPGNPNAELIKQQAITALGMVLRFGSQSIQSNIQQAVELILSSASPNDIEMNHAVLLAIGNLIIVQFPILINYRQRIIEIIDSIMLYLIQYAISTDDDDPNQEKETAAFNLAIRSITDALNIIKWIFKAYPQLSPDSPTQWMATILNFMNAPEPELQQRAILAGMYGTAMIMRLHPVDQPKYFELLISLFNSDYPEVVGKCFKAFNYLVKQKIPFDMKYCQAAIQAAFLALEGSLQFQKKKKKTFDFHSSKNLYRFFKTIFKSNPETFPIQQFIQSGKNMLKSSRQLFEMAQYIKVLNFIYDQCHATLKSLSKKILINVMIECFNRYAHTFTDEDIDYSSFSVPPSPIASIYLLLQYDPNTIQDKYQNTLQLIQLILNHDFNGERFYNATISNAIEFLCRNYQISPDSFDIITWLPMILKRLPLKPMGNEKLTEHIYSVILTLMANPAVIQNFGQEILRVFAQTLGIKDRLFKRFQFTDQTLMNVVGNTKQLISVSGATQELLKSFFTDDQSFTRFCSKIN